MNPGLSKKVIFSFFLFINSFQPVYTADSYNKIQKKGDNSLTQDYLSGILKNKRTFNLPFKNYEEGILDKSLDPLLTELTKPREQLVIKSDKQYEINDVIYAEGNVSVSSKGKRLKADNLIYDKLNKKN